MRLNFFYSQNKKQKHKMKFDLHIVINVLIALAIFYVLDKMVLESRVADKLPKL